MDIDYFLNMAYKVELEKNSGNAEIAVRFVINGESVNMLDIDDDTMRVMALALAGVADAIGDYLDDCDGIVDEANNIIRGES